MPDEVKVEDQPKQPETVVITPTPFSGNAWSETPPEPKKEEVKIEPVVTPAATSNTAPALEKKEEIIIPKEWLKNEFGTEDHIILKQQLEDYKKIKETPVTAAEIKFANDQSKLIHELIREGKTKEVREFLEVQENINNYVALDVNKDNAADIIKLQMKLKNKELTPQEIEFAYKQAYVAPKEPVQRTTEEDPDFAERHDEWKEKVESLEMKRVIDAKMAKPELEKLKSQITLPELPKQELKPEAPSQESLDKLKASRDNFLNVLESNYSKAEGFSTQVKDESVEYPVSFKIPDEDKVAIKERLKDGFDLNAYMDKRWFDDKGTPKIEQIISDIFQLENPDKILSGVANDSARQRVVLLRKQASNIDVNGKTPQNTFDPNADGGKKVSPYSTEAWSEKPPAFIQN